MTNLHTITILDDTNKVIEKIVKVICKKNSFPIDNLDDDQIEVVIFELEKIFGGGECENGEDCCKNNGGQCGGNEGNCDYL